MKYKSFRLCSIFWPGYLWGEMQIQLIEKTEQRFNLLSSIHWCPQKAMATHSGTLAWKIPWTEEPGRLQSMGLLRVE